MQRSPHFPEFPRNNLAQKKSPLEYVHNIEYSHMKGFQSVWIKIGQENIFQLDRR